MDMAFLRLAQQGQREIRLRQRLAPGQGEPAARSRIEHAVLFHAAQDLIHALRFAVHRLRPARAGAHAGVAARTLRAVKANQPADNAHGPGRTSFGAPPAYGGGQAARGVVGALRLAALRLRIAAPRAMQRASLQEHQRTDAFAVVDAEFLHIEHDTRLLPVQHGGCS